MQFEIAVSQLIHHPEYNSTLILRSETVAETTSEHSVTTPRLDGFHFVRNVHRKLLPRRPGRDAGLEQHCTLYRQEYGLTTPPRVEEAEAQEGPVDTPWRHGHLDKSIVVYTFL